MSFFNWTFVTTGSFLGSFKFKVQIYGLHATSGFVQGWQDVALPQRINSAGHLFGARQAILGFYLLPSTLVILIGSGSGAGR